MHSHEHFDEGPEWSRSRRGPRGRGWGGPPWAGPGEGPGDPEGHHGPGGPGGPLGEPPAHNRMWFYGGPMGPGAGGAGSATARKGQASDAHAMHQPVRMGKGMPGSAAENELSRAPGAQSALTVERPHLT